MDQVQVCGELEYDDYGPQTDESTQDGHYQQVVANGAAVQVTWQHQVSCSRISGRNRSSTAQATAGH